MYNNPLIVGADLSITDTGLYSINLLTKEKDFLSIKTKPKDFSSPSERKRYIAVKIKEFLDKQINNQGINYKIIYEGYAINKFAGGQTNNLTDLAELKGVVMEYVGDGITVTTQQLKKIATDYGRINQKVLKEITGITYKGNDLKKAKKQLVIDGVNKRFNFDTTNDNIADACALAHIGVALYEDIEILPSYGIVSKAQLEVVKAVKKKFKEEIN